MAIREALIRPVKDSAFALLNWANRHAGLFLLIGLAAIALRERRRWRQDTARLAALTPPPPNIPPTAWPAVPLVSILVAAWNEAAHLDAFLDSFARLDYPDLELILCVGGEDGSYQIVAGRTDPRIRCLRQTPGTGKRRALSLALEIARGEVIVFTDADCLLNPAGFQRLVAPIVAGEAQVTAGGYRPVPAQRHHPFVRLQWAREHYIHDPRPREEKGKIVGANSAFKRSLLESYWPRIDPGAIVEDKWLGMLLKQDGHPTLWVPDGDVDTVFHTNGQAYVRQQSRWLRGQLQTGFYFRDYPSLRQALMTSVYGIVLLALPASSLLFGRISLVATLLAWSSMAAIYGRMLRFLDRAEGQRSALSLPALGKLISLDLLFYARTLLWDIWHPEARKRW